MALCGILTAVWVASAQATDDPGESSMVSLGGVRVSVSVQSKNQNFLNFVVEHELVTTVELSLRRAGIRVLTEEEMLKDPQVPSVDFLVNAVPNDEEERSYAISLSASLNQRVWIVVNGRPVRACYANTWTKGAVLSYGRTVVARGDLKGEVEAYAEDFANTWLSAHGK